MYTIKEATEGIRTLDLAFTKRLLYHLSYGGGYLADFQRLRGGIIPVDRLKRQGTCE
jgi:hypothetical protein